MILDYPSLPSSWKWKYFIIKKYFKPLLPRTKCCKQNSKTPRMRWCLKQPPFLKTYESPLNLGIISSEGGKKWKNRLRKHYIKNDQLVKVGSVVLKILKAHISIMFYLLFWKDVEQMERTNKNTTHSWQNVACGFNPSKNIIIKHNTVGVIYIYT